jgi:cellulose synthase/poly-beta-1,6-N-acetylglucosamine synthase-like glycosyltransferase
MVTTVAVVLFWVCVGVVALPYFVYPAAIWLVSRCVRRDAPAPGDLPSVALVVAAHNEEAVIARKIENGLAADYPAGRFRLLIVSDGSTDGTNAICEAVADERYLFLSYPQRQGKAHALNHALARAEADILVFSDANVWFEPDALRRLVRHFGDPRVGVVFGSVDLVDADGKPTGGEGLYSRYERFLQRCESRAATVVGIDGAMFAIRRPLYRRPPDDTIVEDFVVAMQAVAEGYRVVYEPAARGSELVEPSARGEFKRKARMVAGGFQAVVRLRRLLNPFRYGLASFELAVHKVLRWLLPLFMIGALAANALLWRHPFYRVLLGAQVAFYALAAVGWLAERRRRLPGPLMVPAYFCAVNAAGLVGLWRFLAGRQKVAWDKVARV